MSAFQAGDLLRHFVRSQNGNEGYVYVLLLKPLKVTEIGTEKTVLEWRALYSTTFKLADRSKQGVRTYRVRTHDLETRYELISRRDHGH